MHEGDKGVCVRASVVCVGGLVNIMVRRLAERLGLIIPHFQTDALPLLFFLPPSLHFFFNYFERNNSALISGVDLFLL